MMELSFDTDYDNNFPFDILYESGNILNVFDSFKDAKNFCYKINNKEKIGILNNNKLLMIKDKNGFSYYKWNVNGKEVIYKIKKK